MENIPSTEDKNEGVFSCWGRLKLKLPWIRRYTIARQRSVGNPRGGFRYDPLSYAQNFDDVWNQMNDEDFAKRGFLARYAAPSFKSHGDHRKTKCKFELRITLDMHKAHNRVEWDAVMEKMAFNSKWRRLVMGCVNSVNFAIILNGQPKKKFAPSQGLCQRDPLSPYLFLLVSEVLSWMIQSEVLSRMIQTAIERRQLDGVKMNPLGLVISHIFFVDDALIFLKVDRKNCSNLVQLLGAYCSASG
ncbi:hypothetical protein COP1_044291 [Malus domestica]